MVYQSNSAGRVAYCVQSALGAQASPGGSAKLLRTTGGAGIKLAKAATESIEIRNDGLSTRGRHGSQKTTSAYNAELSLGSHDPILEAIMRGTWDSTPLTITEADLTSVTTGANSIVASSGSWINKGVKRGDVIVADGFSDAGNNSKNIRVTGVTTSTLTTAETLIVNATPDTSFTITRPGKRLTNPGTLIKRYFTLEEYESDIDQSTVLTDFVWGSAKFSMAPNGIIMLDPGGIGTGQIAAEASGSSPFFTSPIATTGAPMSVVDATIRLNGADLVSLTSFDLSMDIQPSAPDVIGAKYAPDVFTGPLKISMNMTGLRTDLSFLSDFIAETQYSLEVVAAIGSDFLAITVPNFTLGSVDPSAFSKQGGGRTQTISVPDALVGIDTSATGNASMISFQTTAA